VTTRDRDRGDPTYKKDREKGKGDPTYKKYRDKGDTLKGPTMLPKSVSTYAFDFV
jgi:hypothetical protein